MKDTREFVYTPTSRGVSYLRKKTVLFECTELSYLRLFEIFVSVCKSFSVHVRTRVAVVKIVGFPSLLDLETEVLLPTHSTRYEHTICGVGLLLSAHG